MRLERVLVGGGSEDDEIRRGEEILPRDLRLRPEDGVFAEIVAPEKLGRFR